MTQTQEGTFLSIKEAAARAGCDRKTVYRWMIAGKLTRHEDGLGHPRVKESELEALLTPKPVKA
jgi:excisionase family DNA binding protein